MNNKEIFAENLRGFMELNGTSRKDICDALGLSYYTVTDWVKGKKYPRMNKIEMLANYFGVLKSDLIEAKGVNTIAKNNFDITGDELAIIKAYRELPDDGKDMIKRSLGITDVMESARAVCLKHTPGTSSTKAK